MLRAEFAVNKQSFYERDKIYMRTMIKIEKYNFIVSKL